MGEWVDSAMGRRIGREGARERHPRSDARPQLGARASALAVGAVLLLLGACREATAPAPYVDLSVRQPLPQASSEVPTPLHLGVAGVVSPQGTLEDYAPLAEYLGRHLGRPVELVQRRTYAEVNDLIARRAVDVAFVCTSAYVAGRREFGMRLLVAPEVRGKAEYRSLLIVPVDSPARSMADLRGKVFAFTDPMSNTGRLYPTSLVMALGETPETFFQRTFWTYSHDDAVRAVADGLADGAGVDSLVYDAMVAREPRLGTRTKIIHRSPPFASPPVVVSPDVHPALRDTIQELLLGLDSDADGRSVLTELGVDRFVVIEDAAYASVRALEATVNPEP